MDTYDPEMVYSAVDQHRRYAYFRHPTMGLWNLTRFAECLLPLLSDDLDVAVAEAKEALDAYTQAFEDAYQAGLRLKLSLLTKREGDEGLGRDLLRAMAANGADFTLTFRQLCEATVSEGDESGVRSLFADPGAYDIWAQMWRRRLEQEPEDEASRRTSMLRTNPAYIPRNHHVEAIIRAGTDEGDFAPFHELLAVLANPFDEQSAFSRYAEPPAERERVLQTSCGT